MPRPVRPAWIKAIYNSPEWAATRIATLIRDHYSCKRCGKYGDTAHHIIALEDGGAPFDLTNTATLCRSCHAHVDNMRLLGKDPRPYVPKVNRFLGTVLQNRRSEAHTPRGG
jgi:5-methylcytosine-specific restriction endonuclease McrA